MTDGADGDGRLRALVDAGIALASELSLDELLQRLLEIAADLAGARYAALGVIAPDGSRLERFLTHGLDPSKEEGIATRPEGRGLLGVLLHEARPVRLHDLAADPRSVGFPPGHPAMHSFLGVPVILRGVAYGNLYLTEKSGGSDFTVDDEEIVTLLAAQAAVAIENARLYEAATRWSARLESLNEIGNALATETELDSLLDLVARRLQELLGARSVSVLLPSGPDELRFAAVAGDGRSDLLGATLPRAGSKSGLVLAGSRSERIDSLVDDPDVDPLVTRRLEARTGLWVPLLAYGKAIGVLVAHDKLATPDARFSDDDLRLAEIFASRAAVAVDLSRRTARDSLSRMVTTQETERRLIARELHDETAQALTSILLELRRIEQAPDLPSAREALDALRELAVRTLKDVRRLAVDLHPRALEDFGLVAALERLVEDWRSRTGLQIDLAARLGDEKLTGEVATALYRIVQEALVNVVKHARAHHVSILLNRQTAGVTVLIEDDGQGFSPDTATIGPGLQIMRERAELVGGRLRIESAEGRGTTLSVEAPLLPQ
jgi:signal transduction histidine kinase